MAYCEREDLESIFGAQNIAKWADLDSSEHTGAIENRIAHAIAIADAEIDSVLVMAPYRIPLADDPDSTPALIREVSATLAGVYLYEGRGAQAVSTEQGQPVHPYMFKRMWAMSVLNDLRTGKRRIAGII